MVCLLPHKSTIHLRSFNIWMSLAYNVASTDDKLVCFLIIEFWKLFIYFGYQTLVRSYDCEYPSPVCGMSSQSLLSVCQRTFILFRKSNLSYFALMVHAFGVLSRNLSDLRWQKFSHVLFQKFLVLGFIFMAIIHFELMFGYGSRYEFKFISYHMVIQLFKTICWKDFSPMNSLAFL